MVRRQDSTLSWFQKGVGKVSVTKEQDGFGAATATEGLQLAADEANFAAHDQYMIDLANQQGEVDISRAVDHIPVKPLYASVSDPVMDRHGKVTPGVQTLSPWPDPLPELIPKRVFKSGSSVAVEETIVVAKK